MDKQIKIIDKYPIVLRTLQSCKGDLENILDELLNDGTSGIFLIVELIILDYKRLGKEKNLLFNQNITYEMTPKIVFICEGLLSLNEGIDSLLISQVCNDLTSLAEYTRD